MVLFGCVPKPTPRLMVWVVLSHVLYALLCSYVNFMVGNDNVDKCFIEGLGVSRNYNLDNPTTFKEKTTREEVEVVGTWLIWGFIGSIKKG